MAYTSVIPVRRLDRAAYRGITLYRVLQQERSHPNWRTKSPKNLQTVCWAGGMSMLSARI